MKKRSTPHNPGGEYHPLNKSKTKKRSTPHNRPHPQDGTYTYILKGSFDIVVHRWIFAMESLLRNCL